ncbi:MAG: hypothetical protein OEU32_10040 [Acidimicrobiia bacterium]|nr:hypothetical protein [Acidimicrobiia bacterium]
MNPLWILSVMIVTVGVGLLVVLITTIDSATQSLRRTVRELAAIAAATEEATQVELAVRPVRDFEPR